MAGRAHRGRRRRALPQGPLRSTASVADRGSGMTHHWHSTAWSASAGTSTGRTSVPTYQYACTECGHGFEAVQSFTDDALTECPRLPGPAAQGLRLGRHRLQGLRLLPQRQPRPKAEPASSTAKASTRSPTARSDAQDRRKAAATSPGRPAAASSRAPRRARRRARSPRRRRPPRPQRAAPPDPACGRPGRRGRRLARVVRHGDHERTTARGPTSASSAGPGSTPCSTATRSRSTPRSGRPATR